MNKYIKVLSLMLALTSSVYLPSVNAANTIRGMLITIAENTPVLIDRLNNLALNEPKLLQQIIKMAGTDAVQLERLLDLAEIYPVRFSQLVTINSVATTQKLKVEEEQVSPYGKMTTLGTINDSGGIIQ